MSSKAISPPPIHGRVEQVKAVDLIFDFFKTHPEGHPVLEACTGSGKSWVIKLFLHRVYGQWPDQRVVIATHQKELIEQNYHSLLSTWADAPAGINSASVGRRDTIEHKILFVGIQSVYKTPLAIGHIDILMVDECHLISKKVSNGMYRTFIDAHTEANPNMRVIGLTATPYRLDGGWLSKGDGALFSHDITAEQSGMSIERQLELGHICPVKTPDVDILMDASQIKKSGGDYILKELAAQFDKENITESCVKEMVTLGADRKSWLIFGINLDHCRHIVESLKSHGIDTKMVDGKMQKSEREQILTEFKAGHLRALVNCGVLTTGFDAPNIDLLGLMRPTSSTSLYVQIIGRGFRISPSKKDCMVLDFAGMIATHGPVNRVKAPVQKKAAGDGGEERKAATKTCEHCGEPAPIAAFVCAGCGMGFPITNPAEKLNIKPSKEAIISEAPPPQWHEVSHTTFHRHGKKGSPDMLRLDHCDQYGIIASTYFCWWHKHEFPRKKAYQLWTRLHCSTDLTGDIDQSVALFAMENEAHRISAIKVDNSGKFPDILEYEISDSEVGNGGKLSGQDQFRHPPATGPSTEQNVEYESGYYEYDGTETDIPF